MNENPTNLFKSFLIGASFFHAGSDTAATEYKEVSKIF